jgi:DNA repair exonuclease SbcCD ATPase subunit
MLRALNVSFRLLICASLIASTWPAAAQQQQLGAGEQIRRQLEDQQGQISELESAVRELRAQNSVLTDLLKGLVSNQVATSKATQLSKAEPAELKQEAEKALPRADDALKKINNIPDDLIDSNLKQRIQSCINNVKTAAESQLKAPAPKASAVIDACKEVDQRAILAELEKARKEALAKWEKCRATLEHVGAVNPASLPLDPSGLSPGSSQDVLDKIQKLKEVYA